MWDGTPKAVLYEGFARVGRALGSPARIELLNLLAQGEHGVEELAAAAGLKVSNTSAQLKTLAAAGLVTSRREGRSILYAADYGGMQGLMGFLTENCCQEGGCGPLPTPKRRGK